MKNDYKKDSHVFLPDQTGGEVVDH